MKKRLLLLFLLFLTALACHAQSNETFGDKAMASGNYEQAVTYFMEAVNQAPTEALKNKLNLATMLRNEFRAIDQAIANHDADEVETHIANVLMIDPNNKFVESKRTQYAHQVSKDNQEDTKEFLNDVLDFMGETFLGSEDRQDNFGYVSLSEGVCLLATPDVDRKIKAELNQHFQFRYYEYFPVVFDFNTQLGLKPLHETWSIGGGSCFFIGDYISVDYGLGYHQNLMEYKTTHTEYDDHFHLITVEDYEKRKDSGLYYRTGFTLMGGHGLGLSYCFTHYANQKELPFNTHQISLNANLKNVFNPKDWETSTYLATYFFLALHAIGLVVVYQEVMK